MLNLFSRTQRKLFAAFTMSLMVAAACSDTSTSPLAGLAGSDDLVRSALALSQTGLSGTVTVVREVALLDKLPANLKLSDEQRAKLTQLVDGHASATRIDRDALNSIATRAMNAINNGRPREEVIKILDEAKPVQQRLASADADLIRSLATILTAEQNAWLQSQLPAPCDRSKFPPLTAEQQRQIASLDSAFAVNNRADIEAVRAFLVKASDAKAAGKSEAEINAILEPVKPILDRLAAATRKLQEAIAAVYTAEQKATGCVFLG